MITHLDLEIEDERERAMLYLMNMQMPWPQNIKEGAYSAKVFNLWRYMRVNGIEYFGNGHNKPISYFEYLNARIMYVQIATQLNAPIPLNMVDL